MAAPYKYYPVPDLSGGLNLKQLPWNIAPNECVIAENCDFWTKRGAILGRSNARKINPNNPLPGPVYGLYRFLKSDGAAWLIAEVDDGSVRDVIATKDFETLQYGVVLKYLKAMSTGVRNVFETYEDVMYSSNGVDTPFKWDGEPLGATQWGIDPPKQALFASISGSGNLTGTYSWKVVFKTATGARSPNSYISNTIVANGNAVALSNIVVSDDPQVTIREIYRQGGLLTDYYLIATINDNSTTTFLDNVSDVDATDLLDPYDRYPAPKAKSIAAYLNRMFVANLINNPHSFTWARARQPEEFYNPATADPVGVKGKQILWLKSLAGSLFFGKEDSIYALRGADETTFYLDPTYVTDGAATVFVADMGTRLAYTGYDGVYSFDGLSATKITEKADPIFQAVDPGFIHGQRIKHIQLAYNPVLKRLYISYPDKAYNDSMLVIDLSVGAIHRWLIDHTCIYYDSYLNQTLIGDANGYVYQLEPRYPDTGTYHFRWMSKAYDCGFPKIYKTLYECRVKLDTKDQDLDVSFWADNQKVATGTVNCKGEWVFIPASGSAISGINFQVLLEGDISTPIELSPPMTFKFVDTDIRVSQTR